MQFDFEKPASAGNYEAMYAIEHYTRRMHAYVVYVEDTTIHLLLNHCLNSPKVSFRPSNRSFRNVSHKLADSFLVTKYPVTRLLLELKKDVTFVMHEDNTSHIAILCFAAYYLRAFISRISRL